MAAKTVLMLLDLPVETNLDILEHVDLEDLARCRQVSKDFRNLIDDNESTLSRPTRNHSLTKLQASARIFGLGVSPRTHDLGTAAGLMAALKYFYDFRGLTRHRHMSSDDHNAVAAGAEGLLFARLWQNLHPNLSLLRSPEMMTAAGGLYCVVACFMISQTRDDYERSLAVHGPRFFQIYFGALLAEGPSNTPQSRCAFGFNDPSEVHRLGKLMTEFIAALPPVPPKYEDKPGGIELSLPEPFQSGLLLDLLDSARLARILNSPMLPPIPGLGYAIRTQAARDLIDKALVRFEPLSRLHCAKILDELYINWQPPPIRFRVIEI